MKSSHAQSFAPDLLTDLKTSDLFENVDQELLERLGHGNLTRIFVSQGEMLIQQGGASNALYVVVRGQLKAILNQENNQIVFGSIGEGEIVGEMQILLGGKHTANVYALTDAELIKLPKTTFEKLIDKSPDILQKMALIIVQRLRHDQLVAILPDLFGPCDETTIQALDTQIEWVHISRGKALFRQGDIGDSLYIVINGLLQAVTEDENGKKQIIGKIYQGESVGEMAIIAGTDRTASIYALRDSELVKLSKSAFELLIRQCPQMMKKLAQLVINRLNKSIHPSSAHPIATNIAVIPVSSDVPLTDFCHRLVSALSSSDSALHLNSNRVDELIGMSGAAQVSQHDPLNIKLMTWLYGLESKHRFIIYETDKTATHWTKWCLRLADQVILVADATTNAMLGSLKVIPLTYYSQIKKANQTLVLLHPNGNQLPSNTRRWLSERQVKSHHHIRWDTKADFERLARFISGRAIGLVMGGGGARGFAHFGVFMALKEAGVPIDMIGGTSMGAAMGAQCAADWDIETMRRINRKGLIELNPIKKYTLPIISLTKTQRHEDNLKMAFGDKQIEDLWTNFFCVSSNLTTCEMVIHRQGTLWKAIRASGAIPGIIEPMLEEGNLLVDGGVLNNLPGDVMRQFCHTVIAVDVSCETHLRVNYEKMPSPWAVLWSRILPFKKTIHVPSIFDVLICANSLAGSQQINKVKADADFYLHPPVDEFGMLEFTAMEKLIEIGYQYAKKEIENWKNKEGIIFN
jgi:NTE family protein/lysophospholipid hydrolase